PPPCRGDVRFLGAPRFVGASCGKPHGAVPALLRDRVSHPLSLRATDIPLRGHRGRPQSADDSPRLASLPPLHHGCRLRRPDLPARRCGEGGILRPAPGWTSPASHPDRGPAEAGFGCRVLGTHTRFPPTPPRAGEGELLVH